MNFFKRRKILKNTSALELIPIRKCEHKVEEDSKITILVPKFKNPRVSKFMLGKRNPYIFMHLDESGSQTWLLIDGVRNIGAISAELRAQFGEENFQEGENRVNKFMSRLYQERYITFRQLEMA